MSDNIREATALFNQGYSCAQAILKVYGPSLGLDPTIALRLGAGLTGGGKIEQDCGALTAAVLILGLKQAEPEQEPKRSYRPALEPVRLLKKRFHKRFTTLNCRTLIRTRSSFPAPADSAHKGCALYVAAVAEILEDLISENTET